MNSDRKPETKTVFCLVRTTPAWLALSPAARDAFVETTVRPLLADRVVRVRYFDAEAFSAMATDVLVFEYEDDRSYRRLVERLRETPFWGHYFEIVAIVPAVEDDFVGAYGVAPLQLARGER